jgi:hypothetical protein
MTDYDEMTEDELEQIYKLTFNQRYPDRSLLLRRVLKMHAALKEAEGHTLGYPASAPPRETGVYLIHDGLRFKICEYYAYGNGDGTLDGWVDDEDDDIHIARWWYLPLAPQETTP